MKKETDYEEQQSKKIGGRKLIEIALVVVIVVLGANLFLSSRNVKAATANRGLGTNGQNGQGIGTQYKEEEAVPDTSQDPLEQLGVDYYLSKYGEGVEPADIRAIVENFGCHMEIHIYKSDERVMRLSYFNGQVYEI